MTTRTESLTRSIYDGIQTLALECCARDESRREWRTLAMADRTAKTAKLNRKVNDLLWLVDDQRETIEHLSTIIGNKTRLPASLDGRSRTVAFLRSIEWDDNDWCPKCRGIKPRSPNSRAKWSSTETRGMITKPRSHDIRGHDRHA